MDLFSGFSDKHATFEGRILTLDQLGKAFEICSFEANWRALDSAEAKKHPWVGALYQSVYGGRAPTEEEEIAIARGSQRMTQRTARLKELFDAYDQLSPRASSVLTGYPNAPWC